MKKKVPRLKTDKEAEAFLAKNLSDLVFRSSNRRDLNLRKRTNRSTCVCPGRCLPLSRLGQMRAAFPTRVLSGKL